MSLCFVQFPFDSQTCFLEFDVPDHIIFNKPRKKRSPDIGALKHEENKLPTSGLFQLLDGDEEISLQKDECRADRIERDMENLVEDFLSDVKLDVNQCIQVLETEYTSDEYFINDIFISAKNFDFTIKSKRNKKCKFSFNFYLTFKLKNISFCQGGIQDKQR